MRSLCLFFFAIALSSSATLHAQPKDDGAKDYEDVKQLEALETQQFKALEIERGSFDLDLIAPSIGRIHSVRSERGSAAIQKTRPKGSALFSVPRFRNKLNGTKVLGIDRHDEPSVRAYIDFFDGRGKPILAKWISRMGRYRPMIERKLTEAGMPTDLIYVAMIESGFSPWARSPAAAVGVWQFIPSTGRMMGLRIDGWVDERRDPELATDAAIGYLRSLKKKFGSWELALASYNGGPGLVSKTVSRLNTNNYWLIQRRDGLYDETRRYVPKVLAAGIVTKNADIFGLDTVDTEKSIEFDVVKIPANTRFSLIAKGAGVDLDAIERLNPKFLSSQTPPGGGSYDIRIPKKSMKKFVARFDQYVKSEGQNHVRHRVKFGQTLDDLSNQYGVPSRVIRVANGISNRGRAPYGSEIIVPNPSKNSPKKNKNKMVVVVPMKGFSTQGKTRYFYRVNGGDTLAVIARGLELNSSDIVIWNQLDPNARLKKGMILQILLPTEQKTDDYTLIARENVEIVAKGSMDEKKAIAKKRRSTSRPKSRFYHKVRNGESLWIIARRYKGVTVMDLRRWNPRLRKSNMLQPGDKLVIYPKKK